MRKLFQNKWHDIKFENLVEISHRSLPGEDFYKIFYKAFFNKYNSYSELDPAWLKLKESIADYCIDQHLLSPARSILSLGCGIGIIEKRLYERGYRNIFVSESSTIPLKWIQKILPTSHIFESSLLEDIPRKIYDNLLMGSIDYFLDDEQLSSLLNASKSFLTPTGSLIMLSWSFEESPTPESPEPQDQQFWGWIRTTDEYIDLFNKSGFKKLKQEIVDTETQWKTLVLSASL